MSAILELAARIEAAEGPDGELDMLIWAALNDYTELTYPNEPQEFSSSGRVEGKDAEGRWRLLGFIDPGAAQRNWTPYGGDDRYPKVTASLDAAMTLVPEGWDRRVQDLTSGKGHCELVSRTSNTWGEAADWPLAVCAAALRARAAK